MVGFILMIDESRPDNGATRFVPGSQGADTLLTGSSLVPACGVAGFRDYLQRICMGTVTAPRNGQTSTIHSGRLHSTHRKSGANLPARMRTETLNRIGRWRNISWLYDWPPG